MFNVPWIEYVGYAASVGSLLFAFYGFTIKAYPVAIVNTIIVFTNIYFIYNLMKEK